MNNQISYLILYVFSVFISSCSQVLLKKSADLKYDSRIKEYLNVRVIVAYTVFFLSAFLTTIAFKYVNISVGNIIESFGYFFVVFLSAIFLKEKIGKRKLVGALIVILGVLVYNM